MPHLISVPSPLAVIWAPQMTLQQYLSPPSPIFRCPHWLREFLSIPWCYLLSSPPSWSFHRNLQNCLPYARRSWDMAIPSEFPFLHHGNRLGDRHALQLHSVFCCEPPRSHGLVGNVKKSPIASHLKGLGYKPLRWDAIGDFSRVLLSRSSSHMHKGRCIRWASASA